MSEQDFNFATTILTSKTPQQAAAIIPNVITGSTGVNKDLISWFKLYTTTMDKYNQGLQQLVDDAKRIAHRSNDGFNNFPRNWNCLLNAIQTEHDSNEVVNKNVKMEILNPLKELIEKDVRVSELVVNGQELQEISHNLNRDGEIQWNYKAPQSFQNLEDFKKVEIQLMFDIILNFFQIQNGKLTKDLKNNENSTNYLLGSYKFDHEMQTQLKYLVDTQFQIPHNANVAPAANPHEHKQRRMSSFIKQDNNKPTSPKKPSKLKSRVGSIFGRKKKKDKFDGGEAIPENGSTSEISLPVSRTRTSSSMLSRNNSTRRSFATSPKQVEQEPEHTKLQPAFPPLQPNHVQQPIAPTTPVHEKFLPPKPLPEPAESPNVVKYNDSDDSSTEERRASLLEKHELSDATPTGVTSPFNSQAPAPSTHVPGSRQSSDGIYSFEAGDDARPIQATPRTEQNGFEDPTLSPEKTLAPPPPPARKVLHHDEPSVRDSTVFHNLPTATNTGRDSIIAPLASQDTGHTLLKNDFKHQNLTTTSGLSSSIAEVINASFKDGELVKSQVIGEIAFNYNGTSTEPIAVNIPNEFKKVIVNKTFMDDLGSGNYKINPLSISAKTLGGLKYLLNPTEVPIIIQQIWKFEPHQSSLMVSIRSVVPLVLENFVVSVALNQDIQATSASSKPQGTFNEEKNRITWRYSQPLHLNGEERLIARFMTNGLGSEHESGVQIKFQVKDPQIKYCSIYADNQEIPTFRNLVSGSYSGHSVN
ncbi:hypothetical protein SBY92_003366 [Candida maltosa Xu316]